MSQINAAALETLVRIAMASGVAKVRLGQVDPHGAVMDALGDFPAEFLATRTDLVDALTRGES